MIYSSYNFFIFFPSLVTGFEESALNSAILFFGMKIIKLNGYKRTCTVTQRAFTYERQINFQRKFFFQFLTLINNIM